MTDEERREVAREMRIRALEGYNFSGLNIADEIGVNEADYDDSFSFCDACWYRLADLIEPQERTCQDDGIGAFRCDTCVAFALRGMVTDLCGSIPIRFCPNCGAKVVE